MFELIARVLAGFYGLPVVGGSYGFAIIMLTIAVMVLLMPLTLKATRSTIKMQQVQPELKKIQKKHKGDREALNAEMMELYQENGINPIGGCLPMLAQMPVFLVLFRILRGLTRRADEVPFYDVGALAAQTANIPAQAAHTFNPRYLATDSAMYIDLNHATEMKFGPFDLAGEALDILKDDFVTAIPYIILILFVVATSFYQQKQVSARRDDDDTTPVNSQQQKILKVLPLMTGIWSFIFPAGLVLYWATSNVFRIGQQAYITHQIYGKEGAKEIIAEARVKNKVIESEADKKSDDHGSSSKNNDRQSKNSDSKSNDKSSSTKKNSSKSKQDDKDDGSRKSKKSTAADKEAAWQKKRDQKAKVDPSKSSRITPKGTSPKASKKNRKR
jgi:YidC/Oxa1 family membrane protein insertase